MKEMHHHAHEAGVGGGQAILSPSVQCGPPLQRHLAAGMPFSHLAAERGDAPPQAEAGQAGLGALDWD